MSYASMPSFSFILTISEKKNFEYCFENLPFMSSRQPIKSVIWTKVAQNMDDSSISISVKQKPNIPNDLAEIVNFHFSHYKSMETLSCHSNQSSYPTEIKNIPFVEGNVLSKYAIIRLHPPYGF